MLERHSGRHNLTSVRAAHSLPAPHSGVWTDKRARLGGWLPAHLLPCSRGRGARVFPLAGKVWASPRDTPVLHLGKCPGSRVSPTSERTACKHSDYFKHPISRLITPLLRRWWDSLGPDSGPAVRPGCGLDPPGPWLPEPDFSVRRPLHTAGAQPVCAPFAFPGPSGHSGRLITAGTVHLTRGS